MPRFNELNIVIENPKGTSKAFRRKSAGDPNWKDYPLSGVTYPVDYGYIDGFRGEDKAGLDIFVGSGNLFGRFRMWKVDVPAETKFFARVTAKEMGEILAAFAPVLLDSRVMSEEGFMIEIERFRSKGGDACTAGMPTGLSHITFIVRNLNLMETLLTTVLGATKVYDSGDRVFSLSKERFFLVADIWIAIMEGDSLRERSYNHVAFEIEDAAYDSCLERIRSLGLDVREGRPRTDGEGRSIYFHDFDNHLFELHSGTLTERLALYASS